ncbi:YTH domain-containing protein ECT2-like [Andrographis paniculata]|uniref:YTH domain-containing protein ECT2-like n=1 Tax=Andrographis paniculata TaxID=175694 RepID=UPI0021E71D96|nr:YTH domain-containing protein ECT2-like [Andrographis paniculata]XP_051129707.1 YTH domain-containing protein ECT2-like [Andrographis paniculata]XP_051129708.1 YTH domain-containing protein ECT2-like [Andrographis paniculata]XP_051129709.1 YTH domain-containing protein ECT2-like [Andrographis paniculata]
MYKEGTSGFCFNHGFYYPQYIGTGYESTEDWEDQHKVLSLDGQDFQFTASSNEILPYVYYAPDYGYSQSLYNPYNPCIPGASMGVDGSFVAPQQSYTYLPYDNLGTAPGYAAMILQPRPDITANGTINSSVYDTAGFVYKANAPAAKNSQKSTARVFEGSRSSAGFGKQSVPSRPWSPYIQARSSQGTENKLNEEILSGNGQSKVSLPSKIGSFDTGLSNHAQASPAYKAVRKFYGRVPNDAKVSQDSLSEQNQGYDMYKHTNKFVVKAYTSRAGTTDAQGNITIYMDQYNKVDFPLVYTNAKKAKFFVIKSYSEDDVHKSIKYNVWSSTPNGNRKLNAAYEDAQRIAAGDSQGCPIFLMFSVNSSGQFCGVAEMTGTVDPHKDMDFWQQDKWNGSFPVKWHIIKDVPNPKFRHIILENNENKPVTNSRDTQEISYKKGLEMLHIFQNYPFKTSLMDDFMYYESRQRILHEERAKLQMRSSSVQNCTPHLDSARKCGFTSVQNIKDSKQHEDNNLSSVSAAVNSPSKGQVSLDPVRSTGMGRDGVSKETVPTDADELQIGLMKINSEVPEEPYLLPAAEESELVEVVTIGSMLVRVNEAKSSGSGLVGGQD